MTASGGHDLHFDRKTVPEHRYQQYCALARAPDVAGDRWTLLIVRDGVVARRELPAPTAQMVYELTAAGRDLADAIVPLIRWGTGRLGERKSGESFRPRWSAVGMAGLTDPEAANGINETYQCCGSPEPREAYEQRAPCHVSVRSHIHAKLDLKDCSELRCAARRQLQAG